MILTIAILVMYVILVSFTLWFIVHTSDTRRTTWIKLIILWGAIVLSWGWFWGFIISLGV
nr:MAG TPA: hypothetical protein [Caudoviricetes sp.]